MFKDTAEERFWISLLTFAVFLVCVVLAAFIGLASIPST